MLLVHFLYQVVELLVCQLGPICLHMLKVKADISHCDLHVLLELVYVCPLFEDSGSGKFLFELAEHCLVIICG